MSRPKLPEGQRKAYGRFYLTVRQLNRLRSVVFHTRDHEGEPSGPSEYVGEALDAALARSEERFNGGKPFPDVPSGALGFGPHQRKPKAS